MHQTHRAPRAMLLDIYGKRGTNASVFQGRVRAIFGRERDVRYDVIGRTMLVALIGVLGVDSRQLRRIMRQSYVVRIVGRVLTVVSKSRNLVSAP